ncbi:HAD family hydrolase [Pseudomonas sp. 35 E 8]|uniref:HAD family hydrolase n=1 Tax=Pseudomonas sp. 35 E 8 TaxID=1844103 RepID=UPI0008121EAB|nr:HAD family hydrolase [Pseudomonas sp. 35 E 8]CRM19298.1 HAD hydrolase, REG-2-like, family IA [Pseudomonas sp. 35 E 8]
MISAVAFDAFGTIVRIGQRTNPYRELFREGRRQGVALTPDSAHLALTTNLSLDDMALSLGISLTPSKSEELRQRLELELSSIEQYPDAVEAISLLKEAGVKTGICSNLSSPYGPKVRDIFPLMDGYAFSYEAGATKPDPVIYRSICAEMDVEPGHYFGDGLGRVLMIGDSQRCDRDGPRVVGITGFYLDRTGRGQIHDLVQFAQIVINSNSPKP